MTQKDAVVEVGGHKYAIGRLSAFDQFHVGRRLAPIFAKLGAGMVMVARDEKALADADFVALVPPIMEAVQKMSDEDSDFVLHTCLSVVERFVEDGRKMRVLAGRRQLQFEDINMPAMVRLAIEVVRENMSDFLPGLSELTEPRSS